MLILFSVTLSRIPVPRSKIKFETIDNGFFLGVVAHAFNPDIGEAEAGGSWVSDQPGLHSKC